jgi:ubiquinone/menaquinone biosynthesis C-methylase UbiE
MNSKLNIQHSKLPTYAGLVRWAFTRFYREFAWTYDTVAVMVSGGRWFAWGRVALSHMCGRVLELGCGTGHFQQALGAASPVGLDASSQMLAITRRRLTRNQLSTRLVRGFAQALPFFGASFDTIVATFPTDYIVDRAALDEIRRVLGPDGRLVIVLAATFGDDSVYARVIDLLYRATLQRSPRCAPTPMTQSAVARHLAECGFAVDERWEPAAGGQVHLIIASAG